MMYQSRKLELSVQQGCLLWGSRVIIPKPGRAQILALLHDGHPGISKMKGLARSYVWWPNIDADLETQVKQCNQCQLNCPSLPAVPMHPWERPDHPWDRVHVDYTGPFMGQMFLVVIEAYSKWIEIEMVKSATAQNTIEHLHMMFARFGLPKVLVTDNETCFTSSDFSEFTSRNGIGYLRIAPYHPSSNGQAERAVQTFKLGIKKQSAGTLQSKLSWFLFHYRLTPHGVPLAKFLLNRQPCSHLDLVVPSLRNQVKQTQQKQKTQHDRRYANHSFQHGDSVLAHNFRLGSTNDLT